MTAPLQVDNRAELLAAAQTNHVASYTIFGFRPEVQAHDTAELAWLASSIPSARLNRVLRTNLPAATAAAQLEQTLTTFADYGGGLNWLVWPDSQPADLPARLLAHGLRYRDEVPCMVADLRELPAAGPVPPELTLELVEDEAALCEWLKVLGECFSLPAELLAFYQAAYLELGLGATCPLRFYLARLAGKAVACSSMLLAAGVVGIYKVGTLPAARRQGVGAAITRLPMQVAAEAGYRFAVLRSSVEGYGVYQRLGFADLCRMKVYLKLGLGGKR